MVQGVKKTQHYIPRFILDGFTDSKDQVIEMLIREKKIFPTAPGNSMAENYAYEHPEFEQNSIEDWFCQIEGAASPEIGNLRNEIEQADRDKSDISRIKERAEGLYMFFILSYYRSGALLTEFSMFEKKFKIPLLTKKITDLNYIEHLSKTIKCGYNFAILKSDSNFLLSDQCVSTVALKVKSRFFDVSNRHIGLQETLILIPVSSRYYIALWNSKDGFGVHPNTIHSVDDDLLRLINRAILNNSYKKSVAQKKERLEEVQNDFIVQYPSQVFAGGNPDGYSMGAIHKKEVFFTNVETQANELLHFLMFDGYKKAKVNDPCPCRSGKKYKKCHMHAYERVLTIMRTFKGPYPFGDWQPFVIPNIPVIEYPIDKWAGFSGKGNAI